MEVSNDSENFPNNMGINPPPVLTPRKSDRDYIPQIHADERQAYVDCKLNDEPTIEEIKPPVNPLEIKSPDKASPLPPKEHVKPNDSEKLAHPTEKKAIKLITVPHELEGLNNKPIADSSNPQEYDSPESPSIDMRSPQKDGDDSVLSPNSVRFYKIR